MRKVLLAMPLIWAVTATTARADWQYTHWGMSREQVMAASGGKAVHMEPDLSFMKDPFFASQRDEMLASQPSLRAPFTSGSRNFDAQFVFKGGGLSSITLEGITGSDCYALQGDLEARYGKPFAENPANNFSEWQDQPNNNRVMFVILATGECSITYTPLTTTNSSSL
jgi:hypothetical protein